MLMKKKIGDSFIKKIVADFDVNNKSSGTLVFKYH